jgi:hypothetical protein
VGHSQGTTLAFAALSQYQDVAARIKYFVALAPVTRIGSIPDPFFAALAPFADLLLVCA